MRSCEDSVTLSHSTSGYPARVVPSGPRDSIARPAVASHLAVSPDMRPRIESRARMDRRDMVELRTGRGAPPTSDRPPLRLFVFHENAESIPSRFLAMPPEVDVHLFRVCNPVWSVRAMRRDRRSGFAWGRHGGDRRSSVATVPGLRRFRRLSDVALRRTYLRAVRAAGRPDAVVYDSPYLAGLAEATAGPSRFYVAPDPFAFYNWDIATTERLERVMLEQCDASFAVSAELACDFRRQTVRPVHHLPNAVPHSLIETVDAGPPRPADLAGIPGPIVGCVGKINSTYDWTFIGRLAEASPDVSFVFIGPIMEPVAERRQQIRRLLARPNLYWLGPRPYEDLPAYLAHFDVALNPLLVDPHNHRRSPLRLYEYVAAGRPILSTRLHSLAEFDGLVEAVDDPAEAEAALRRMLSRGEPLDAEQRREWLMSNTWEARAQQFLAAVAETVRR
ncbi:MAG: glycosyltransferase [Dehalococcoidia bacterium]|nr:glycosyltransferase [Dehalococcoidia bacterium]